MVFQNKIVAAIKVGGEVLRENENTVTIPFGSEYSVFVKNLNAVRSKIKVSIDGNDVTSDTWLVINPNSTLELERFIRNGNWESGNRFKFIERTKEIEGHRGVRADDGIVRIEYQVEEMVQRPIYTPQYRIPYPYYPRYRPYPLLPGDHRIPRPMRPMRPMARPSSSSGMSSSSRRPMHPTRSTGVTAPGSQSNQRFSNAEWFETTGQSEVIILHLRGIVAGKTITKPITVSTKLTCESCGKVAKSGTEFCSRCGTAIVLV